MGLGDGIRELVADVGVQAADINSAAVTSTKLQDCAVVTDRLQNCAITSDKIAFKHPQWYTGTFALTSCAAATGIFTITVTSNVWILGAVIDITAASTVESLSFNLGDTAGGSIMCAAATSVLCYQYPTITALSSFTRVTLKITAGKDIGMSLTAAKTPLMSGRYAFLLEKF